MGATVTRGVQRFAHLADNDCGAAHIQAVQPSVCELRECADPDSRHDLSPFFSRLQTTGRQKPRQPPIAREGVHVCLNAKAELGFLFNTIFLSSSWFLLERLTGQPVCERPDAAFGRNLQRRGMECFPS